MWFALLFCFPVALLMGFDGATFAFNRRLSRSARHAGAVMLFGAAAYLAAGVMSIAE